MDPRRTLRFNVFIMKPIWSYSHEMRTSIHTNTFFLPLVHVFEIRVKIRALQNPKVTQLLVLLLRPYLGAQLSSHPPSSWQILQYNSNQGSILSFLWLEPGCFCLSWSSLGDADEPQNVDVCVDFSKDVSDECFSCQEIEKLSSPSRVQPIVSDCNE